MRSTSLTTTVIAGTAGLGLLAGGITLPSAATAEVKPLFAEATPLVLKDGRIANVSVHRIPFNLGENALDAATAEALRALIEPLATDCFLTAQAIGHVAPGAGKDGDTLSAHRLARARADHVQATLAGHGLPQPAVASVWDWQFLVERSEVTLWIFSLNVGDDCDGTPLPDQPPLVADATDEEAIPAAAAAESTPPPRELRMPDAEPVEGDAALGSSETVVRELSSAGSLERPETGAIATPNDEPTDRVAAAPVASPVPAREAMAVAAGDEERPEERVEAVREDPLATASVGAVRPAPPASAEAAAEPVPPAIDVAAVDDAATSTVPANGAASALVITFDVNSSFFPAGAVRELRRFLETLPADAPVGIELVGAVGTGEVRGASAEEAARYNAWMAERRLQRVAEWLDAHAGGRRLTVTERLVENDSSRKVRLRASRTD